MTAVDPIHRIVSSGNGHVGPTARVISTINFATILVSVLT
jgi:hypothetical protein